MRVEGSNYITYVVTEDHIKNILLDSIAQSTVLQMHIDIKDLNPNEIMYVVLQIDGVDIKDILVKKLYKDVSYS